LPDNSEIYQLLEQYWSYSEFREGQKEVIESCCNKRDTIAVMATGSGKSICYQISGLYHDGLTIVVSPLIALMADQHNNLKGRGIKSAMLTSNLSKREQDITIDNVAYSDIRFLFLSPERLSNPMIVNRIEKLNIKLLAIDEAHCISEWGHDFRPEYRKIAKFKERIGDVPVIALTATATKKVIQDIASNLDLKSPFIYRQAPTRSNLDYSVMYSENKKEILSSLIKEIKGLKIVYVTKRKKAVEIARYLNQKSISTIAYHGGMDPGQRSEILDGWLSNQYPVIVSTKAFGMGIDKSDVRAVIHMELPDSIEAYVQEAGRAGRDGLPAQAILLYNNADFSEKEKMLKTFFPDLPYIQSVYQNLSVYYDLASGVNEDHHFPYNHNKFCKKFQLPVFKTFNALTLLSKASYIFLSDSITHPSRLLLNELRIRQLLNDKTADTRLQNLIGILLRNYEGLYLTSTRIDENFLAKKMKLKPSNIKQALTWLDKHAYAKYQENYSGHFLGFTNFRFKSEDVILEDKIYSFQKNRYLENTELLNNYVSNNDCRQSFINSYFGFDSTPDCNICDNCKSAGTTNLEIIQLQEKIIDLLQVKSYSIVQLLACFEISLHSELKSILRELLHEEILLMNNDQILLKK